MGNLRSGSSCPDYDTAISRRVDGVLLALTFHQQAAPGELSAGDVGNLLVGSHCLAAAQALDGLLEAFGDNGV